MYYKYCRHLLLVPNRRCRYKVQPQPASQPASQQPALEDRRSRARGPGQSTPAPLLARAAPGADGEAGRHVAQLSEAGYVQNNAASEEMCSATPRD